MTTLTPHQRIAAYEWAAERIAENPEEHIWTSLPKAAEYPELKLFYIGETSTPYHWYTHEARLFILGSCILMAEEEISKQKNK